MSQTYSDTVTSLPPILRELDPHSCRGSQAGLQVLEIPRSEHPSPCLREFSHEGHEPKAPRRLLHPPRDLLPRSRMQARRRRQPVRHRGVPDWYA